MRLHREAIATTTAASGCGVRAAVVPICRCGIRDIRPKRLYALGVVAIAIVKLLQPNESAVDSYVYGTKYNKREINYCYMTSRPAWFVC